MKPKKERLLTVDASDSLNFLLYVHNYAKKEKHRFPYMPGNPWKLQEKAVMQPLLRQLWNESLSSTTYPSLPLYHQKGNFRLLFQDESSFKGCLDAFFSWWGSMTGSMAVERFIGQDGFNSLYTLFRITDKEMLTIHLLYENDILGSSVVKNQLVLTLRETLVQEEMITTMKDRLGIN